ncbi:MAG TPA: hypothetical protein VMZ51_08995 [Acidimicrobiales bacterium]|nr:hypothetical protein [Acidimicrobiales bacterium]
MRLPVHHEQARAERYQIEAFDAQGNRVVSNEGVLYKSAKDASAAMEELRSSIRECPKGRPVESPVEGVPLLTYDLTLAPEQELADLAADRVALTAAVREKEGQGATFGLVYQRRGRVLVGLYDGSVASVRPYARVVAQRLAALSAEEAQPTARSDLLRLSLPAPLQTGIPPCFPNEVLEHADNVSGVLLVIDDHLLGGCRAPSSSESSRGRPGSQARHPWPCERLQRPLRLFHAACAPSLPTAGRAVRRPQALRPLPIRREGQWVVRRRK